MKPILTLLCIIAGTCALHSQHITGNIIDTFETKAGKVILYENNKWVFLKQPDSTKTEKRLESNSAFEKKSKSKKEKKSKINADNLQAATDVHIIQKGETLMSLSRTYKIPLKKIFALNGLNKNSRLKIGQKIKLR